MTKKLFTPSILVAVLLALAVSIGSAAFAQPAPGSAPAGAAPADSASPPAAPAAPAIDAAEARKACAAAMNADPKFEAEIVKIADEKAQQQRDRDTLAAHTDANNHVQKNERHVIYAYAAMWIIAAAFLIFLWRRQQGLQSEIAQLHRELDAAAADKPAGGRS
jgi:hypothetical protein